MTPADPHVRIIGTVEDIDGVTVAIGVDYDAVTVSHGGRFGAQGREKFAHLFAAASWRADEQARFMTEAGQDQED